MTAAIRRKANWLALEERERANADRAADYLLNKAPYLDSPKALAKGWPIATGVIEGACRHLVKDRMDITGARWGLHGAEAVLRLRACTLMATSTPAGGSISIRNGNACTRPATPKDVIPAAA